MVLFNSITTTVIYLIVIVYIQRQIILYIRPEQEVGSPPPPPYSLIKYPLPSVVLIPISSNLYCIMAKVRQLCWIGTHQLLCFDLKTILVESVVHCLPWGQVYIQIGFTLTCGLSNLSCFSLLLNGVLFKLSIKCHLERVL